MRSMHIRARVDEDGSMTVTMPPELAGRDVDVVMVFEGREEGRSEGWPPGFFERTAGAWQGEPLAREDEGEYEVRDRLG